jgi:hypothetical protein
MGRLLDDRDPERINRRHPDPTPGALTDIYGQAFRCGRSPTTTEHPARYPPRITEIFNGWPMRAATSFMSYTGCAL